MSLSFELTGWRAVVGLAAIFVLGYAFGALSKPAFAAAAVALVFLILTCLRRTPG
jgi:hypothetical protein